MHRCIYCKLRKCTFEEPFSYAQVQNSETAFQYLVSIRLSFVPIMEINFKNFIDFFLISFGRISFNIPSDNAPIKCCFQRSRVAVAFFRLMICLNGILFHRIPMPDRTKFEFFHCIKNDKSGVTIVFL